ncbi:hypothetical protein PM082_023667 [Marasmius tenuissimus]|nr:hypothetical protein PM082_023667 [Marasmius tenuissimus]
MMVQSIIRLCTGKPLSHTISEDESRELEACQETRPIAGPCAQLLAAKGKQTLESYITLASFASPFLHLFLLFPHHLVLVT